LLNSISRDGEPVLPSPKHRLFTLRPDQLEAARSWIDYGARTPSKARYASSVVLLKDGPLGLQTYLGYRRGVSPLGVVSFPGGSVEVDDDAAVDWVGPSPSQWAGLLGITDESLARRHVMAAIRETFEETGLLLAGPDASSLVEGSQGPEWIKAREAIASQEKTFAEMLNRRGLALRTDLLKPIVNWVSPDFAHRRFNTRYFAAAAPVSQEASVLPSKGLWGSWVNAAELISQRTTTALGDGIGQPDTQSRTLSELTVPGVEILLEKIAAARGCIAYLNHKRPSMAYKPQLVEVDGELMIQVAAAPSSEGAACRER
jgi:8-oxo-dGTP pyrophosphatase MutT (NUDIX family)